jgi:hypothetical protein
VGHDWSGFTEQLLGGWQVNGILTLQSGYPITPVLGFDNSNTGLLQDRPNLTGDPNKGPRTVEKWFDTGVFVLPAQFSYGNAGKNILEGPPTNTFDFSLFKNWKLVESVSLQFRAGASALPILPHSTTPGHNLGTGAFGVISWASQTGQFGLKIIF